MPWLWGDDAVADRDSHASRSRHPRHPKRKEEGHRAAGCRVDPNSTGTPSTDFPGERRGWSHGPRATLAKRLPDSFLGGPVRPASLCSKCHPYSWLGWFCFGEGPICRIIRSSVHVKSDQRKQKKKSKNKDSMTPMLQASCYQPRSTAKSRKLYSFSARIRPHVFLLTCSEFSVGEGLLVRTQFRSKKGMYTFYLELLPSVKL